MEISKYLDPEAIILNLSATSSDEVIINIGSKLRDLGYVKDNFVEAALAREADMPTGLPLGGEIHAAIPHVDIEYVNKSALGLVTLTEPVVFNHMVESDTEVSVRLVIMLALDKPKSQIEMLQQVAGLLQQPEIIQKIMEANSPEEVFAALA